MSGANNWYQVEGDLTPDSSSDAYPLMTLCEDCVPKYNGLE